MGQPPPSSSPLALACLGPKSASWSSFAERPRPSIWIGAASAAKVRNQLRAFVRSRAPTWLPHGAELSSSSKTRSSQEGNRGGLTVADGSVDTVCQRHLVSASDD